MNLIHVQNMILNPFYKYIKTSGQNWRMKNAFYITLSKNTNLTVGGLSVPDRHPVGIWTVQRSSAVSSVEVPMKSKVRQLRAKRRACEINPCWNNKSHNSHVYLIHVYVSQNVFNVRQSKSHPPPPIQIWQLYKTCHRSCFFSPCLVKAAFNFTLVDLKGH